MQPRLAISILILTTSFLTISRAQDSKNADAKSQQRTSEQVVRDWFERWNALDGSDKAIDRFMELYRPDATHQTSPSEKQMGAVVFEGRDQIRQMVKEFSTLNKEIAFHLLVVSANEKSSDMLHFADGPWGGLSVALQYVGAYTRKGDNTRWMYPGAAFFQIQDGKIRHVRMYMCREETMRVYNR